MARRAAIAGAILSLCLPAAWAGWQRGGQSRRSSEPHYSAPRPQASQPRNNRQQQSRPQARPRNNQQPRNYNQQSPQYRGQPLGNNFQQRFPSSARPSYPGSQSPNQELPRPAYRGYGQPDYYPPGHLGSWLNQHRDVPVQDQEKLLGSDPSFRRLPRSDQQRLMQQLHSVDQMPALQRQRRLERAEALERLSPQGRAQVNRSARLWQTLPPQRQAMMKQAFRDLRSVPPDQRPMVLNSNRYRNVFNPQERGILSDLLSIEPYEAPR
jgi:hypothetical protein